jgi:hypothetical protein
MYIPTTLLALIKVGETNADKRSVNFTLVNMDGTGKTANTEKPYLVLPNGTVQEATNGMVSVAGPHHRFTLTSTEVANIGTISILYGNGTTIPLHNYTVQIVGFDPYEVQDYYQAKVWLIDDNAATTDRYAVAWYNNGHPLTSGVTSAQIQVVRISDGTDLIAATNMDSVTGGFFRYNATGGSRVLNGAIYMVRVTATIDGSTRVWLQPVGRDSVGLVDPP